jgi:phosphate/sulfate permease
MNKNKTLATWLAFVGGPLGLHRFYLYGFKDILGWLLPLPTALGWYGIGRIKQFGQDDALSWILVPMIGFVFAACALTAIVYGLTSIEKWNTKHNPHLSAEDTSGQTQWLTIGAIVLSLLMGATALMGSIAFSFQRYFEYQVEEGRKISQ